MESYALTDVGRVRAMNQDYIYASPEPVGTLPNLFLVADGMGGHRAGDYASRYMVENLVIYLNKHRGTGVVGQLKNGETLVRTGRNDSAGWSRLEYNGQTVYAVTAYLTTDLAYKTPEKPSNPNRVSTQDGRVIVFTDCDDYITPKELINLRTEPSTSEGESTVRTQVRNGTNLHRTGYSEASGWSRVEYNGEILYAVTNYVISGSAPE